jgi:hypothetical protein
MHLQITKGSFLYFGEYGAIRWHDKSTKLEKE